MKIIIKIIVTMEINRILKYIILVLLILLAILTITYKFDDCSHCSFKINDSDYSANSMAILYYNKCIYEEPLDLNIIVKQNLSSFFNSTTSTKS